MDLGGRGVLRPRRQALAIVSKQVVYVGEGHERRIQAVKQHRHMHVWGDMPCEQALARTPRAPLPPPCLPSRRSRHRLAPQPHTAADSVEVPRAIDNKFVGRLP